jgi:hypothetical protein
MTHWRVMLSKKRWDQVAFAEAVDHRPELLRGFAQSKGAAKMKETPAVGDFVSFVWDGKIIMTGVVRAGFQEGILHQNQHDEFTIGNLEERLHALPTTYALIDLAVLAEPHAVSCHTGQRTWIKKPAHLL